MKHTFTITDLNPCSTWHEAKEILGQQAEALTAVKTFSNLGETWMCARLRLLSGPWQGQALFINGFRTGNHTRTSSSIVCRCNAYPFPHSAFGGKCDGREIVHEAQRGGYCQTCHHADIWAGDSNEPASFHCKLYDAGSMLFLRSCPYIKE